MKDDRIHTKVSAQTRQRIKNLAKKRKISVSSVANELLEKVLENEEELWLARLVEESEKESKGNTRISLEDVCRKLGIESNFWKRPQNNYLN
jgi:predicted DNA-binding protein